MSSEFSSLPLVPELLTAIAELGYQQMTPIQQQSLPVLLSGQDLLGQSKTGSGKTLAFALPILQNLDLKKKIIQALVMCPTRELCTQVAQEIRKLGRKMIGLQVLILSGGQEVRPQLLSLYHGAHIAVGTPGRILDLIGRRKLDLGDVSTLVLDEADRMLDMGFQEDMEAILREIPAKRQTLFFSATFPASIDVMSKIYQNNPVRVVIQDTQESRAPILQTVCHLDPYGKTAMLLRALRQYRPETALIFCNLKTTVATLSAELQTEGISCLGLSGDLDQDERNSVLARFRNGSVRVVVATDVAARGLDIKDLAMVVNYDFPIDNETYVHRIGRTGRAGQSGQAVLFVTPPELDRFAGLQKEIGVQIPDLKFEPGPSRGVFPAALMETVFIAGGRKDKVRPGDILGALTGEAGGLSGQDIGKIEIHDKYSYVAVKKELAAELVRKLKEGRIKGQRFFVRLLK